MKSPPPLLAVRDLEKRYDGGGFFRGKGRGTTALLGVSFELAAGETLGIVGESGSGKSTLARCILRLVQPSGGRVFFEGKNIFKLKGRALRDFRHQIQMVFQEPRASLNPRQRIVDIVADPARVAGQLGNVEVEDRVMRVLGKVGLSEGQLFEYPSQLSQGQCQRLAIARALVTNPSLLVCDEPVSALDVSIQAQILNLLQEVQRDFGLSGLFISHDLAVVRYMAKRVVVLYRGRIVESGITEDVFANPKHPHTRSLVEGTSGGGPI